MKIGFGVINYNIREENIATDSSPALRNNFLQQLRKLGEVTIVSNVLKKSRNLLTSLNVNYDMDVECKFDLLILESSGTGFINYNKNLDRLLRLKCLAKNVFYTMHDVRYVIPESEANKRGRSFWGYNVRGILTWGTNPSTIREDKHIPVSVPIYFAPIVKPVSICNDYIKNTFLGYLGNNHNIRKKVIQKYYFDLPVEFKPAIGGIGYDDYFDRKDIEFLGFQPPNFYNKVTCTLNTQDKYSDRYGWLPSKLCDCINSRVIPIFPKLTALMFNNFNLEKYNIKLLSCDSKEEFIQCLHIVLKWTSTERQEQINNWYKFYMEHCSIDSTMNLIKGVINNE